MKLNLQKPLVFIDLETTGTDISTDRIVEISMIKVYPDEKKDIFTQRVNPSKPIPYIVSRIHGIYDKDVKDSPSFKEIGQKVIDFMNESDISGYNCLHFDIPLLMEEILRNGFDFAIENCKVVDVQKIFFRMEPRNLRAALKFYCHKVHETAHSAEGDCLATFDVLNAQIEKYQGQQYVDEYSNEKFTIENDINTLHTFTSTTNKIDLAGKIIKNENDKMVFNFGKYINIPLETVYQKDPGYFQWMMDKDFPLYTKRILRNFMKGT